MNKKFSTLAASLLVAGTLPVGAIQHSNNGEVPYRTDIVKSAVTSYHCNGVKSIDGGLWYQLVVSEGKEQEGDGTQGSTDRIGAQMKVLTMERDYMTGNLTLVAKTIEEAALTHSLWKITAEKQTVDGNVLFVFENKETGYKLTFDEFNAVDLEDELNAKSAVKNVAATVLNGCTDQWRWYSTPEHATNNFTNTVVFSYFHTKDSVMAMALNKNDEVVLVKQSRAKAENDASNLKNLLKIKPVIAGPKVLNAAEINSMIDADGSWKNFTNIATGNTADNTTLGGTKVNFTFSKSLSENPLTKTYKAVESPYAILDRDDWAEDTNEAYSGYNILLQNEDGEYLMVSTDRFESPTAPGLYGGLLLKDAPYQKLDDANNPTKLVDVDNLDELGTEIGAIDAHQARYHFKFTYYPTNDSLVIEPLNASVKESENIDYLKSDLVKHTEEGAEHVKIYLSEYYNTVNAGVAYDNNEWGNVLYNKAAGVPVALGAINNGDGDPDASQILTVSVPANVRAAQTQYATLCQEVYNCSKSSKDGNPAYVTNFCDNHIGDNGTVEYVANMGVKIGFNHKYTYLTRTTVNAGLYFIQLSTATAQNDASSTEKRHNGSYIVADMAGHYVYDTQDDNQDFKHMPATQWVVEQLNCDVYTNDVNTNEAALVRITNREYASIAFEGQLYSAGEGKYFFINHKDYANGMNNEGTDNHIYGKTFACIDTLTFTTVDPKTTEGYEVISDDVLKENVYALQQLVNGEAAWYLGISGDNKNLGLLQEDPTMFELHMIGDSVKYGYTPAQKETQPGLKGINQLYKAVYAVKVKDANKIDNDHTYIALDHMQRYVIANEEDIQAGKDGLTWALFYLKNNNCVDGEHYYSLVNATDAETSLNINTVAGKLVVEASTFLTKVDNLCSTSSDVFRLAQNARPLYANLEGDDVIGTAYSELVNNEENGLKLGVARTGGYLYEEETPALYYLSHENLNTGADKNNSFYVDKVAKSNARMPQYLFVTAADSVDSYRYCETAKHGINPGCDHEVTYPGYVSGRFLVNLNDSVRTSIDKVSTTDKFMSDGYVRLAFVEAVHRGDSLYVLKAPYTLASISVEDVDGTSYVLPPYLSADSAGVVYDIIDLDGTHNNAAFSLRYVGDTENDGFLLESFDYGMEQEDGTIKHLSGIGSFEGAWVKLQNGVPVLAQISSDEDKGDHNTGDNLAGSEYYEKMSWNEVLNQAAVFGLAEGETGNGGSTANEDITASSVTIIAGNGQITINGAAGKKVVVSNILGQVVANTVITSDNATIAAPQGVVVVAVEGEEAVKAIVK